MLTYEAIMPSALTIGATIPMLLSAAGAIFPEWTKGYLPIGKSDFIQLAIFLTISFGIVVVAVEGGKLAQSIQASNVTFGKSAAQQDAAENMKLNGVEAD